MLHDPTAIVISPAEATGSPVAEGRPTFEALFEHYEAPLYHYVYRMVGDEEEARDLTQDAFVKIFKALPRLRPTRTRAWVYRIATNVCLDALRRRRVIRWESLDALLETDRRNGRDEWTLSHPYQAPAGRSRSRRSGGTGPVEAPDPQHEALRSECKDHVQQTLDRLYARHRGVLVLREYHGLTYAEIAVALTSTCPAVKALLFRARQEFRQVWQIRWGAGPYAPTLAG